MTFQALRAEENIFKNCHIAVLGDIMLDTFVYGDVNRISPEAPVPVLRVRKSINTMGGAGNVASNLAALGATVSLIGRIGADAGGEEFMRQAKAAGIDASNLISGTLPTTRKTRIVSRGQQIVRIDEEETDALDDIATKHVLNTLKALRKKTDTIVVSDYDKGVIGQSMLEEIKTIWKGGNILVDPKPRKNIDYSGVTTMTPNTSEAAALLGDESGAKTDAEAADVATRLFKKFKLKHVLLTRANDGMTLHDGKDIHHFKPPSIVEIRDVSGAGDTVMALMAAGIAAGLLLDDTVELATFGGKIVVSKTGTATVTWPELIEDMKASGKFPPYVFR